MATRIKNIDEIISTGGTKTLVVADVVQTGDAALTAKAGLASANNFTAANTGAVTDIGDAVTFDLSQGNNFKCAATTVGVVTFSNLTAGQSGNIHFDNTGGAAHSYAGNVLRSGDLGDGVSWVSYYTDGTNVLLSISGVMA